MPPSVCICAPRLTRVPHPPGFERTTGQIVRPGSFPAAVLTCSPRTCLIVRTYCLPHPAPFKTHAHISNRVSQARAVRKAQRRQAGGDPMRTRPGRWRVARVGVVRDTARGRAPAAKALMVGNVINGPRAVPARTRRHHGVVLRAHHERMRTALR